MRTRLPVLAAILVLLSAPALAQHRPAATPRAECPAGETALTCAASATPAFTADGTLLLAWSAGGRVMVARTTGDGTTLAAPVAINPAPETIDDAGEARPVLAVDGSRVFVAYSLRQDKAYNGRLMLARSEDGGRSFEAARAIADDPASQRFAAMGVSGGRLTLAWIDKRGLAAARRQGKAYAGAALALAWSDDGGRSFAHQAVAEHHSCECCRVAMAFDAQGRPVLMWRHVFAPNVRDHALIAFTDRDRAGPLVRVAEDDWRIDACPHHGPALAVAADGSVSAAWYTAGKRRQGLFLARSADGGKTFAAPRPIGNADNAPSHPQLLAEGPRLWLAWKEFDGQHSTVMVQSSADNGQSWTAPTKAAETADASDHPLLISDGKRPLLSWLTRAEGWRLIALGGGR
ncbi:MAG: exo-alpha-sialidase [Magnetospirillum sp.]|nr:exo-alpha-sialidase [Magnetospirillum sp.]